MTDDLTSNVELLMDHAADCEERNAGSCIVSAAIRALIADNERLRAFVEQFLDFTPCACGDLAELAHEALSGKQETRDG